MALFFDNSDEIYLAQAGVNETVADSENSVQHTTHATSSAPHPIEENDNTQSGGHGSAWLFYAYGFLIISVFIIIAAVATRKLKLKPGKLQNFFETAVDGVYSIPKMVMGERATEYAPFIATFFIAIICMNFIGLVPGFRAATANPSITFGLSIVAFFAVQYYGIKAHGWRYIKHFMGPSLWLAPLIFIIEMVSELVRPLSLAMRLYGNIYGEETVIEQLSTQLVFSGIPVGSFASLILLPLQLLSVFLQAYVFTLLVSVYISMATEKEGH